MTQSSVLRAIRGLRLSSPTLPRLAAAACNLGRPLEIGSARADAGSPAPPERASDRTVLSAGASVLVVIPQYRCEEWLEQCLSSMVTQTRKAHGIVVVDDGSTSPPTTIVERFPSVTLLRSRENVGPYRLIESVIRRTRYDAYLFQDADDWSTSDRLELLIAEAEKTGAELVGCQELKVTSSDDGETFATTYPLDVNRALALEPTHALVHPASLVARALVERIGGFASELRFGGDTEFLFRAAHVARIVNVDRFCYFTRVRPGSLTTSEDTRAKSPARRQLGREIVDRARQNYGRAGRGEAPDLRPLRVADAVPLEHVTGPALVPSG
jgi:glycosyltransferase involved in cell wall biosynthesis